MKEKLLAILLIATMTISLSACGSTETSNNNDRKVEKLEKQIEELQQQLAEAQQGTNNDSSNNSTSSASASINETTAETWGVCGENLTWYYQNGILVIRGTGDMTDYSYHYESGNIVSEHPWNDLHDKIQWVHIEDGVTSIGERAFASCAYLSKIEIPNSVTTIGDYAFIDCTDLENITIPNSVTVIGEFAFSGCGLTSITLHEGITTIKSGTFRDCDNLVRIDLPKSVTTIEEGAFILCDNLEEIVVPNANVDADISKETFGISTKVIIGGKKDIMEGPSMAAPKESY